MPTENSNTKNKYAFCFSGLDLFRHFRATVNTQHRLAWTTFISAAVYERRSIPACLSDRDVKRR